MDGFARSLPGCGVPHDARDNDPLVVGGNCSRQQWIVSPSTKFALPITCMMSRDPSSSISLAKLSFRREWSDLSTSSPTCSRPTILTDAFTKSVSQFNFWLDAFFWSSSTPPISLPKRMALISDRAAYALLFNVFCRLSIILSWTLTRFPMRNKLGTLALGSPGKR